MEFDSADNLYLAEGTATVGLNTEGIRVYSSTGTPGFRFNKLIYITGGVGVDSSDNVYIAAASSSRIEKFDSSGNFLMSFGSPGSGDGQFATSTGPLRVGVDGSGNVYGADVFGSRIVKFASDGSYLTTFRSVFSPGFSGMYWQWQWY